MALGHLLSQSISRNEELSSPTMRATAAQPSPNLSSNLNRLLSAAVINPRFQRLLLTNPVAAVAGGYNGETFQLTPSEYAAVTSLSVSTLRDSATQLLRILQEALPFGAESQADFQFAEGAKSGRDSARENLREQPATLPCKQESESPYTRFSAPSRHTRQSVAVNEGYRTTHSIQRYGSR